MHHSLEERRLMNEKKDDLKNKDEQTACTHSASHSIVRHSFHNLSVDVLTDFVLIKKQARYSGRKLRSAC